MKQSIDISPRTTSQTTTRRQLTKSLTNDNNTIQTASSSSKQITSRSLNNTIDKPDYPILSDDVMARISSLENEMESRLQTYVSRERAYNAKIEELINEIESLKLNKTGWMKYNNKINSLKLMHEQIINNIELVQDRTSRILHEQEKDLLKAFRSRLYDIQSELDKEKSKKDDGAGAWIERCRILEAELEYSKESADRLERINQSLLLDNNRLKSDFTSHEEDRNFLISQLVIVKKDNAKLRAEYSSLESEVDALRNKIERANEEPSSKPVSRSLHSSLANRHDSEEKYKDINIRLKRLLTEERKSLQQLRLTYSNELKSRSELELLLRQCVDDIRKDIAKHKLESGLLSTTSNDLSKLYSKQPGMIPINEFTKEDRNKIIELLLSQEKIINLLYSKTFPITSYHKSNGNIFLDEYNNNNNKIKSTDEFLSLDGSRPTTAGSNHTLPLINQSINQSSSQSRVQTPKTPSVRSM